MKNLKKIIALFVFCLGITLMFSQKITTQSIEKPSEGKSLVYVAKTGAGALVNFRIYDGDRFLGALSGFKYIVYECDPGEHVFWAASENRDYVKANLDPNSVYFLNAAGQMGAFVAGVNLKPLNPSEFKDKRLVYQIIKNSKKQTEFDNKVDKSENIKVGLEKYEELLKSESMKIGILDPTWKFENADKPIKEKK